MFANTMSMQQHINDLISQCNQRLFLLSQLKYQNLSGPALGVIFQALVVSKMMYALPAFAGHNTVANSLLLIKTELTSYFVKHCAGISCLI